MKSKMNRNIILIALLGLLSIGKVTAQSVTVEAKIRSEEHTSELQSQR